MKRIALLVGVLALAAAVPMLPYPSTLLGAQSGQRAQTTSGQAAPSVPLATLIQEGRRAEALAMIKAGGDVNQPQPDGTRPIHWAVYRVDHELVDALIAKKARVDVANEFDHTPLAAGTDHAEPHRCHRSGNRAGHELADRRIPLAQLDRPADRLHQGPRRSNGVRQDLQAVRCKERRACRCFRARCGLTP